MALHEAKRTAVQIDAPRICGSIAGFVADHKNGGVCCGAGIQECDEAWEEPGFVDAAAVGNGL
ncbi:hypothetical protein NY78_4298 [Desulfovibrio sp. TomC]|nr:hypothetical protein NY78_4298 [Desulfovibrio sp. TomC]